MVVRERSNQVWRRLSFGVIQYWHLKSSSPEDYALLRIAMHCMTAFAQLSLKEYWLSERRVWKQITISSQCKDDSIRLKGIYLLALCNYWSWLILKTMPCMNRSICSLYLQTSYPKNIGWVRGVAGTVWKIDTRIISAPFWQQEIWFPISYHQETFSFCYWHRFSKNIGLVWGETKEI